MITIEDKRQWAESAAEDIRLFLEQREPGEFEGDRKELAMLEAIAADYRRAGDSAALAGLGRPANDPDPIKGAETPPVLGDEDIASRMMTGGQRKPVERAVQQRPQGELPSLAQPIAEMIEPVGPRHPVGPVQLILIGGVVLALSLLSAWQGDRVLADWHYAAELAQ